MDTGCTDGLLPEMKDNHEGTNSHVGDTTSTTTITTTTTTQAFLQDFGLSDAVINVDNVSFLVHRNIMACCSPYFKSLFMYTSGHRQVPNAHSPNWQTPRSSSSHIVPSSGLVADQCRGSDSREAAKHDGHNINDIKYDIHNTINDIININDVGDVNNALHDANDSNGIEVIANNDNGRDTTTSKSRPEGTPSSFPLQPATVTSSPQLPIAQVTISNVSPLAMTHIVQYAYGHECVVTVDNVQELLLAADRFQVMSLIHRCCQFLTEELSIGNCVSIVRFASHFHHCDELRRNGTRFLLNNFIEVYQKSPEFKTLTHTELIEVLWSDNLNVKHEEILLEAIIQWVSSNAEVKKEFIPQLVACIRVGLLTPEYLKRCLNFWLESSSSDAQRRQVTIKLMAEVLSLQQQQMIEVNPAMFAPRIPRDILIVVGGSNFGFPLNIVEAFDCRSCRWLPIYPHEFAPRSYHGLACLENEAYVVGGFNGHAYLSSCCKFQPALMRWENVTPMNVKRCYVGAVALRGQLYAVGGYDGTYRLRSAEKFDVGRNQWSYVAAMSSQRSDAGVAVLADRIYACGGFNGSECVRTVEAYSPQADIWQPVPSMIHRRSGLGMSACDSRLYVAGGFDGIDSSVRLASVECFDPVTLQWTELAPLRHPRSNLAVVVLEELVYAVGGYSGRRTTDAVECYDPLGDAWHPAARLSHNRSALRGCLLTSLPNAGQFLQRGGDKAGATAE